MEKKRVLVDSNSRFFVLRDAHLFEWELFEEKAQDKKVELFLQRDNETKHYPELVKLEKAYFKMSSIPMGYLFLLTGLALIFMTLYLIMTLVDSKENNLLWLLVALLPGILSATGLGVLAILRTKESLKHANDREDRYNSYLIKVQDLKNEKVRN